MSGFKGQPGTKATALQGPVPGAEQAKSFDEFAASEATATGKAAGSFDEYQAQSGQAEAAPVDGSVAKSTMTMNFLNNPEKFKDPQGLYQQQLPPLQSTLDTLPAAGGLVGGIAGTAIGGPGVGIRMAGAGGLVGSALKQFIEQSIVKNPSKTLQNNVMEAAGEGVKQAAGQAIGLGIGKGLQFGKKVLLEAAEVATQVPKDIISKYFNAPHEVKQLAVAFNGDVPTAANSMRAGFNKAIVQTQGDLEQPALQAIGDRITPLSPRDAGDRVKALVTQNVEQRYGPLVKRHENFDNTAKLVPLTQGSEPTFFASDLKSWASNRYSHMPDRVSTVEKYADMYGASADGHAFEEVNHRLQDQINNAYRSGHNDEAKFLQELKGRATEHLESRVTDLAKQIKSGKLNVDESELFSRFLQQADPAGEAAHAEAMKTLEKSPGLAALTEQANKAQELADSLTKQAARYQSTKSPAQQAVGSSLQYKSHENAAQASMLLQSKAEQVMMEAQALQRQVAVKERAEVMASGYLEGKQKLKSDYAEFKGFMADTMEQTKTYGKGIKDFIQNVNDVPSEKLMDKMLDPKNSNALGKLKQELPEVFQQVVDSKVRNLTEKSMVNEIVNGENVSRLDISKFHKNVMDVPLDVRRLIFSPEEVKAISGVVNNKKYIEFNRLTRELAPALTDLKYPSMLLQAGKPGTNSALNLGKLSLITKQNMVTAAQNLAAMEHFGAGHLTLRKEMLRKGIDVAKPLAEFAQAAGQQVPGGALPQLTGDAFMKTFLPQQLEPQSWHPPLRPAKRGP